MEAGRRSTRSDGRKRRREGEAQVEESIDDEIDDGAAASSTNTQRKPDEDAPHRAVVESEKTKKIKTTPIPHKARALNATLKDLQSSFGISVPSNPPAKGAYLSLSLSTEVLSSLADACRVSVRPSYWP